MSETLLMMDWAEALNSAITLVAASRFFSVARFMSALTDSHCCHLGLALLKAGNALFVGVVGVFSVNLTAAHFIFSYFTDIR